MTETTTTPETSAPSAAASAPKRTGGGLGGKVLAELQEIAAELGISGAAKMRKGALIDAIKIARGDAGTSTKAAVRAASAPAVVDAPTTAPVLPEVKVEPAAKAPRTTAKAAAKATEPVADDAPVKTTRPARKRRPAKRSAIEVTGRLTAQLDAWILAESVESAAELRALSELGVPLAQGTHIGVPKQQWPQIDSADGVTLPSPATADVGTLRSLIRQAYTTCNAPGAQAVLPRASAFEYVMIIDDTGRPVSLMSRGTFGRWEPTTVMTVNIDTPVADALSRAMSRPPETRFTPLVCTDAAGRFVGILKIDDLIGSLTV